MSLSEARRQAFRVLTRPEADRFFRDHWPVLKDRPRLEPGEKVYLHYHTPSS